MADPVRRTPRQQGLRGTDRLAIDAPLFAERLGILDQPFVVDFDYAPLNRGIAQLTAEEFARFLQDRMETQGDGEVPLAYYFHVPYCTHRCGYCRCYRRSKAGLKSTLSDYAEYVVRQLEYWAPRVGHIPARYYSIGGGTPSLLPAGDLRAIFRRFHDLYRLECRGPISTFEMSVPTVSAERVALAGEAGFRRVSLGVQTLNPDVRGHYGMFPMDPQGLGRAVRTVHDNGLFCNTDLIVGLAGETAASFVHGFETILSLRPDTTVVNLLWATDRRNVNRVPEAYIQEVAAGMRAAVDRAGYHMFPYRTEMESVVLMAPRFLEAVEGHWDLFGRLAAGVRAVHAGTTTLAFGNRCESAIVPDQLVAHADPDERFPDARSFVLQSQPYNVALRAVRAWRDVDTGNARRLNRITWWLQHRSGLQVQSVDFREGGIRVRHGRSVIVVEVAPPAPGEETGRLQVHVEGDAHDVAALQRRIAAMAAADA